MNLDDLHNLYNKAKDLNDRGRTEVPFEKYFPKSFMQQHTKFDDIYKFIESGNFGVEDIDDIDPAKLDAYIKANSDLEDWEDFKGTAGQEYSLRELGLDD